MSKKLFYLQAGILVLVLSIWLPPAMSQIVIDHTCRDLSQVPQSYINTAKGQFQIWYGHTSHGSQITTGMGFIHDTDPLFSFNTDGSDGALRYVDDFWSDLGHTGNEDWYYETRNLLETPGNTYNMIMWSWCAGVSDNTEEGINTYLNRMNQLEGDYPDVTFVYMTGHLDGTGSSGNLHRGNNQIRDYCRANGKLLYDYADIERYDPDGVDYLDQGGGFDEWDACAYDCGDGSQCNWADEWCAAHPDQCPVCANPEEECCAHSKPLNCLLKGRAFWWMMARLAGWDGGVVVDPTATASPTEPALPTPDATETPVPTETEVVLPTATESEPTAVPTETPTKPDQATATATPPDIPVPTETTTADNIEELVWADGIVNASDLLQVLARVWADQPGAFFYMVLNWYQTASSVPTATLPPTSPPTETPTVSATPTEQPTALPEMTATATPTEGDGEVTIPDANLAAGIRAALNKPAGAPILRSELAGLTSLTLENAGISDLTGLEYATGLATLLLSFNNIGNLAPVAGLNGLVQLELNGNQIADISPLQGLSNLNLLGLAYNQIQAVTELVALTQLQQLNLYQNQLSSLEGMNNMLELTYLNIAADETGYNQVTSVSALSGLTKLVTLRLGNNLINDLSPLAGLTALDELDLSYNNQTLDLTPLAGLSQLRSLNVSGNTINSVQALAGLSSLEILTVADNNGSCPDISPLSGLTGLTHLWLGYCEIASVSAVSGLTNLEELRLDFNQITDASAVASLTGLQQLDLSGNELVDWNFLGSLTNLTNLGMAACSLSAFPDISNQSVLRTLLAWDNQINDLSPLSAIPSLEEISLSGNQISSIAGLTGLTGLSYLDLSYNQISDLQPLVDNTGIGTDDFVNVVANPLDANSVGTLIPALVARGVNVQTEE